MSQSGLRPLSSTAVIECMFAEKSLQYWAPAGTHAAGCQCSNKLLVTVPLLSLPRVVAKEIPRGVVPLSTDPGIPWIMRCISVDR